MRYPELHRKHAHFPEGTKRVTILAKSHIRHKHPQVFYHPISCNMAQWMTDDKYWYLIDRSKDQREVVPGMYVLVCTRVLKHGMYFNTHTSVWEIQQQ